MLMRASLENFANDTTMHGASKIILSRGRLRRCIWLLTFIAAWTMFVIQICFVLHNYFTFQKKISIEVVYGGVPFPDITICSNRRQDFYELYKDIAVSRVQSNYYLNRWSTIVHNRSSNMSYIYEEVVSVVGDSNNDVDFNELIKQMNFNSSQSIETLAEMYAAIHADDDKNNSEIRSILDYLKANNTRKYVFSTFNLEPAAISMEEFIVSCMYNGKKCEEVGGFTEFKHHYFVRCFTYSVNSSKLIKGLEHGWSSILMSGDGMLKDMDIYPVAIHGLYNLGNAISGKSGARVVLHPPGTRPSPIDDGFDISPGHVVSLGILPRSIDRLGWPYGNCTRKYPFHGNEKTPYHTAQNQTDCLSMCTQLTIIDECMCYDHSYNILSDMDCLHISDPRLYTTIVSNCTVRLYKQTDVLKISECSQGVTSQEWQSIIDKKACVKRVESTINQEFCICPPPCEEFSYDVSYSLTSWRAENSERDGAFVDIFYDKEYYWRFENSSYPDARRKDKFYKSYVQKNGKKVLSDFSRIIVYMKDDAIQKIIESPLMIAPQLLSEIGGQLGIWVGVSIITLSEVIELVVNLMSQLLRRKISKTSKNETHDVRNNTCELLDVVVVDAEDKLDGNISA